MSASAQFLKNVRRLLRSFPPILALLMMLAGCTSPPPPRVEPRPSLNGTVVGPTLTAWPAGAVLELRLVDFTRSDQSPVLIAEQSLSEPGPLPLRFRLPYDPRAIDAQRDYGLECRVMVRGRAVWAAPDLIPVLTRGRARVVEVTLQPALPRSGEPHAR